MDRQGWGQTISPVARETATSEGDMSAKFVDVLGSSDCQCRRRKFAGELLQVTNDYQLSAAAED
jgi:Uri superfamily endonuclease